MHLGLAFVRLLVYLACQGGIVSALGERLMRIACACAILIGLCLIAVGCEARALPSVAETSAPAVPAAAPASVALMNVKLPQLLDAIKAQRGKVVVIDFWMTMCVPCKKEFPRLVKLHERYAAAGWYACPSPWTTRTTAPAALDFLQSRHATFANYFIDEPADGLAKPFRAQGSARCVHLGSVRQAERHAMTTMIRTKNSLMTTWKRKSPS